MFLVGFFVIVCLYGKMKLTFSKVIFFLSVSEPCKLKGKSCFSVSKINQNPASVRSFFSSYFFKSKGLIIKLKALLKVKNIKIEMIECKHIYLHYSDILTGLKSRWSADTRLYSTPFIIPSSLPSMLSLPCR